MGPNFSIGDYVFFCQIDVNWCGTQKGRHGHIYEGVITAIITTEENLAPRTDDPFALHTSRRVKVKTPDYGEVSLEMGSIHRDLLSAANRLLVRFTE